MTYSATSQTTAVVTARGSRGALRALAGVAFLLAAAGVSWDVLAQTADDRAGAGAGGSTTAPGPRHTAPPHTAASKRPAIIPATGCNSPGALGVSRTVEIDTSASHLYGHQQHDVEDFLQDSEVVLTFDDGPLRPYTTPVLKALDNHCTKATFFSVGRMAIADPAMLREVAKRGHTIGSHTWSHKDLHKIGTDRAKGELELGISAVGKALGEPPAPFFRFPYLSAAKSVVTYAGTRNISIFSIDVDSEDYRTKDPAVVHRRVLNGLKAAGKGIILFHDIQPSTAHALQGILDEMKALGFKVVHVVPKGPAATLPQFDDIAARELARKSDTAASDPLASRSFVWAADGAKTNGRSGAGGPKLAPEAEVLPWGVTAVKPEPAEPEPRRRPPPLKTDDGDWFANLFKN